MLKKMRTNIEIEGDVLNEYIRLSGTRTKKEAVHKALLEAIKAEKKRQLAGMKGKVDWEGDLNQMRTYDKWEQ